MLLTVLSLSLSENMTMRENRSRTKAKSSSNADVAAAVPLLSSHNFTNNPTRVDNIIQKLQKAFMLRRKNKQQRSSSSDTSSSTTLQALLNHLRHCLTILHAKTTSLEIALHCLSHEIWPQFVTAVIGQCCCSDKRHNSIMIQNNIQTLAYHFFIQLLRLHDGHILCVSGECRHEGDVNLARQYGFASQLNNTTAAATAAAITTSVNGCTNTSRLYRPDAVYSGASWDELMNETVGLWHRLQQQYQHSTNNNSNSSSMDWEDFVDERVPELNAWMNEIENCKTRNQRAFGALMDRIHSGREVTQALQLQQQASRQASRQSAAAAAAACRITMRVNLRDKMEEFSIQIKIPANTTKKGGSSKDNTTTDSGGGVISVTLQRRASAFQWKDPQGVLPINFSARDWSQSLALPLTLLSSSSSLQQQQAKAAGAAAAVAAPSALTLAQNKSQKRRRRVILDDDSSNDDDDEKKSENDGKTNHGQKDAAAHSRNRAIEKGNSKDTNNKKQSKTSKSSSIQQQHKQVATTIDSATTVSAGGIGLLVKIDTTNRDATKSDSCKHKNNVNNNNNTTSLTEIKKQSGVNVQALEAACLVVQAEEAETKRQAMAVDLMILDHDNDNDNDNIINFQDDNDDDMLDVGGDDTNDTAQVLLARQQAHLKVKHFRVQLQKTLRKYSGRQTTTFTKAATAVDDGQGYYHPPEYEVWDVRENLRLVLMEAGNRNLFDETTNASSSSSNKNNVDETMHRQRQECLQRAMQYFNEASDCVVEQQALYKTMTSNDHDDDNDARVGPNLFFLHAQALTNVGITFLEQAKHLQTHFRQQEKQESATGKKELRQAIQTLESSLQQLQTFKTQSDIHTKTMEAEPETVLFDLFQAQELESLTHRTIACAYWHQGLYTKAVERFRIAGSLLLDELNGTAKTMNSEQLFDGIDNETISCSRELLEAELLVRIECFYAWTRLYDLGNAFLEQSSSISIRRRRLTDSDQAKAKKKDEEMYNTVQEALRHALSASKAIHERVKHAQPPFVAQHLQDVVSERDVHTPQELENFLADSPEWWRNRQEEMSRVVQPLIQRNEQQHTQHQLLPRNDVDARFTADNFERENEPPKRRFVVLSDGTARRKKKKPTVYGNGGGGIGYYTTGTHSSTTTTQKQHNFRPWGDELLPQEVDEISGQVVPKLPSVCMAPTMPPEIAAFIQRQRQS